MSGIAPVALVVVRREAFVQIKASGWFSVEVNTDQSESLGNEEQ